MSLPFFVLFSLFFFLACPSLTSCYMPSVCLLVDSDAGDIDPSCISHPWFVCLAGSLLISVSILVAAGESCRNAPNFAGSSVLANAVIQTRANITTVDTIDFKVASQVFDFGPTSYVSLMSSCSPLPTFLSSCYLLFSSLLSPRALSSLLLALTHFLSLMFCFDDPLFFLLSRQT